jgi:alpha-galactosidase
VGGLRGGPPDWDAETPGNGPGLVVGIEFNGKSRLRAWATDDAALIESRIDDLAHLLQPGQPFEIPACFVGCYDGDWDEAGYATQRFAEAHVHPPLPDERYPWVQYNSWKYGQEIDEAQQLAVLERCAELGIEVAILDLGWARTIGDWRPNPAKFPRGLRPIADRAHELGMKFGVHVAIAQMTPDAPAALEHPEWLAFGGNDYYGAGAICLGHQPCQEWLIDALVRLIGEEHLDYIIQDGEDVVKRCLRTDHTHAPGDSNYANSTAGLDRVIAAVRRAHPHLVWENCEDGGCMLTYRMARLCHTSITVDNIATYATRQGIYGASFPFSPRYSVRYFEDEPTPYTLRSALFGGPLILMQRIGDYDAQQIADTKAAIAQYKHLRTIIRGGKVIHLLPPRSNVEHHGRDWDTIQAVTPDQARSVVMVYRALGGPPERTIRPRGLHPDASYIVRYADAGRVEVRSAKEIQEQGLTVALEELSSEVIELSIPS